MVGMQVGRGWSMDLCVPVVVSREPWVSAVFCGEAGADGGGYALRSGEGFGSVFSGDRTLRAADLGRVAARNVVGVQVDSRVSDLRPVEIEDVIHHPLEQDGQGMNPWWFFAVDDQQPLEVFLGRLMRVERNYMRESFGVFACEQYSGCP